MDINGLPNCNSISSPAVVPINSEQAASLMAERSRLLVQSLLEHRGDDAPPFLPDEFSSLLRIKRIVQADLRDISGVLMRLHDGYFIKVNNSHHPVRQRFSVAHEIGHILFGELKLDNYLQTIEYRNFNPSRRCEVRSDARERLCDIAATELLMPDTIFKKHLLRLGVSVNSIEELARIFGVSILAAAFRIAEISPILCATLRWKLPKADKKSLNFVGGVGPGISFWNVGRCIPIDKTMKYSSLLHKADEQNEVVKSCRQFRYKGNVKRLSMESKWFGRGDSRYVISLAFLDAR